MNSSVEIALLWLGMSLIGLGLGTFYFAWVAQGCSQVSGRTQTALRMRQRAD